MQRLTGTPKRLFKAAEGATAMEYALLGGLIAVVIVVAVSSVGTSVNGMFSFVANKMAAAATSVGL